MQIVDPSCVVVVQHVSGVELVDVFHGKLRIGVRAANLVASFRGLAHLHLNRVGVDRGLRNYYADLGSQPAGRARLGVGRQGPLAVGTVESPHVVGHVGIRSVGGVVIFFRD